MPIQKSTKPPLWNLFDVEWRFLTRLCGQTPADPQVIEKWLEARKPRVKAPGARSIEEINEEVVESVARGEHEADEDFSALVFQRDEHGGLCFRHGTIKAHIKDCARVLSSLFIGKIQGERSFAVRVTNGVYPDEHQYWVPILRNEQRILSADGTLDKAVHVMTRMGQVNALKRFEYVDPGAVMRFRLKVLGTSVREDDLHHLFMYGGTHGYAGERGDGEGRYEYELTAVAAAIGRAEDSDHRRLASQV